MRPAPLLAAVALLAPVAPAAGAVTALPPPPARGPAELAPGISYQRVERPGPQVIHVLRVVPRPLVGLRPALTTGVLTRRGLLTDLTSSGADGGVVAGVNADYFNLSGGFPSGVLVQGNRLVSGPEASRSAVVIGPGLLLAVERLLLAGRWQVQAAPGAAPFPVRTMVSVNRPIGSGTGVVLYTPDFGPTTPSTPASEFAIALDVDAPLTVNVPVTGTVVQVGSGGGLPIGPGRLVLSALGGARPSAAAELQLGAKVRIDPAVAGVPADGSGAVGGGPLLVQDGITVPAAGEGFTQTQTDQRTARTAIGQTRGGTILLVTSEGPQQGRVGYSVAEQAALMAGLGAVRAMGLDSGGSALMALGGDLVIPWSSQRPIADALLVTYGGVRLAQPEPRRVSGNADGVDDVARAVVRSPVPGRVTVTLDRRGAGTGQALLDTTLGPGSAEVAVDPARLGVPDGPYRLVATLTPADGTPPTTQARSLVLDSTLGSLALRTTRGPARRRSVEVRFRLRRPARVFVSIQDGSGRTLRRLLAGRQLRSGPQAVRWDATASRRPVPAGTYRVVVEARTFLGLTGLQDDVTIP